MSKSTILTLAQWERLKAQLANDYSPSVLLLRSRMKDKLGFTVRDHSYWTAPKNPKANHLFRQEIHLDFYNEPKRTMFMLKYTEYLDKTGKISLD